MNMNGVPISGEDVRNNAEGFLAATLAYYEDEEFRSLTESDPYTAFATKGFHVPPGYDLRVVSNTPDKFYVVFPPDPNIDLSDEDLSMVAGGKTASSVGTAGSASSVGTVPSTVSTFACISSAGTSGTAG